MEQAIACLTFRLGYQIGAATAALGVASVRQFPDVAAMIPIITIGEKA